MDFFTMVLIIVGLCLFETINSIDNAIINADVLTTMGRRGRRWFLMWGILFAVFVIRGLLPWLIVWLSTPGIGPIDAFLATFSNDPKIIAAVEGAAPILLMGAGTFLIFLFFHWLFLESKNFGLRHEPFFFKNGVWFYGVVSIILCFLVWHSLPINPVMAFGAVIGSTAFFITHGFKQTAEQSEAKLIKDGGMSDLAKVAYLEVIDATFSIDGVLGAFAFTLSVPLILIGNGLGAFVVRELTVKNVDKIRKYKYLKNGAMYSIFVLGSIMVLDAFGAYIPEWLSPVATFCIVAFFLWKSKRALAREVLAAKDK